jgi:sulfur carrier protein ThiS
MPTVDFTPNLRRNVDCPPARVAGATVRACLDDYFARHPAVRGYVLDEQGAVRHHVVVFVDGRQIADRARPDEPVGEGASIHVMQALSGG